MGLHRHFISGFCLTEECLGLKP